MCLTCHNDINSMSKPSPPLAESIGKFVEIAMGTGGQERKVRKISESQDYGDVGQRWHMCCGANKGLHRYLACCKL